MLIYNHSKGNSPKEKENVVMKAEILKVWFTYYINYYDENGNYIQGSTETSDTKEGAVKRAMFWNCKQIVFA